MKDDGKKYLKIAEKCYIEVTDAGLEKLHDRMDYDHTGYKHHIPYYIADSDRHMIEKHYRCETDSSPDGCIYCAAGFSICDACGASDCDDEFKESMLYAPCGKEVELFELDMIAPSTSIFADWYDKMIPVRQKALLMVFSGDLICVNRPNLKDMLDYMSNLCLRNSDMTGSELITARPYSTTIEELNTLPTAYYSSFYNAALVLSASHPTPDVRRYFDKFCEALSQTMNMVKTSIHTFDSKMRRLSKKDGAQPLHQTEVNENWWDDLDC